MQSDESLLSRAMLSCAGKKRTFAAHRMQLFIDNLPGCFVDGFPWLHAIIDFMHDERLSLCIKDTRNDVLGS